jgi:invasion protein IalB
MRCLAGALGPMILSVLTALSPGAGPVHAAAVLDQDPGSRPSSSRTAKRLPVTNSRDCRRWQNAAERLGETYGGYRLRAIVEHYGCASLATEPDGQRTAWDWPWVHPQAGASLPPQLHARFGHWQIRCDTVASRRRCALSSEVPLELVQGNARRSVGLIITHFVIDNVSGRETMLWRVHTMGVATLAEHATRGALVSYSLGGPAFSHPFANCYASGCLMEAPLATGAAAATRLWEGGQISLSLPALLAKVRGAGGYIASIDATGFRDAFRELVKLRRTESRSGTAAGH